CEICERSGNVEVHHIRKLADLDKSGQAGRPAWAAIMARRRRKSLVVCLDCHAGIHAGKLAAKIADQSLESRMPGKRASPVRGEAARKRPGFIQHERGASPGSPPHAVLPEP